MARTVWEVIPFWKPLSSEHGLEKKLPKTMEKRSVLPIKVFFKKI
jgi:hypothetical protein